MLCSSSTALLSPLASLIDEMDPAPAVLVGLVDAVLGGLAVELARLGRPVDAVDGVLLTASLTEARGRGGATDLAEVAESGDAIDARGAEAPVAGLETLGAALGAIDVGAFVARDCRRVAEETFEAAPVVDCRGGIDDLVGGTVDVLVDFLRVEVADADFVAAVAGAPVAFETAGGACLTAPEPNVPELMIYSHRTPAGRHAYP